MERIIKIRNLHSRVCGLLIENKLKDIPCVESISISIYSKKAKLTMKKDCTDDVISAISGLGFLAQVHR